jgi:diguanylate cyclase (GGDEF)-like protein
MVDNASNAVPEEHQSVSRRLRVLMIEDSPADATLVQWELKNAGYEASVRRVETASELQAALDEDTWDVVTCDYRLPQFSAPAALELVHNHGADVPFIVISGTIGEQAAVEMMRAGAHDYLMKGQLARLGPAIERELRDAAGRAQRVQAEASLHHQAFHDVLTSLPNRTWLRAELERMLDPVADNSEPFALLLMDLDRFKEVNDTLGHQSGDLLLQQVGPRFRAELLEMDLLARLGGDEFAVLLPRADAERACAVAERLLRALERPFEIDCSEVELGGSIGVALHPEHGNDADALLRRADIAMYSAKEAHSGVALYESQADLHSPERLRLLADLRRAIEGGELVLHYQPQVDVRTGTLAAVEALVRWRHPQRGLVAPDVFIPLAEQTRLIRPLSRWVLGTALRQYAEWHAAGLSIPIALNLSAHDLHDPTLPDLVTELLRSYAVPPEHLRVEITESSLMADPTRARDVLARLRAVGVQIAIDDFGTGYSSLAYLKDLAVDELKIDGSFVDAMSADAGARAIVRAVIDLSDDLGLRVVAEGVEDQATWEALAALGCDVAQGYYFAPPLGAADVAGWAAGLLTWRLEEDRARLDAALADRAVVRGARLAAEEEFLARKRDESVVRDGQERLKLALDAARLATWDWDLVASTCVWAGAADALLGEEPGTLNRSPGMFMERVHADDRPLWRAR